MQALREPQPGGELLVGHIAQMLLIQALRLFLADRSAHGTGWLFALTDRHIGAALVALQADPSHSWTFGLSTAKICAGWFHLIPAEKMGCSIQSAIADLKIGLSTHHRLGMVGNAHPGFAEHR